MLTQLVSLVLWRAVWPCQLRVTDKAKWQIVHSGCWHHTWSCGHKAGDAIFWCCKNFFTYLETHTQGIFPVCFMFKIQEKWKKNIQIWIHTYVLCILSKSKLKLCFIILLQWKQKILTFTIFYIKLSTNVLKDACMWNEVLHYLDYSTENS